MGRNIRISIIEDDETLRDGYTFLIGATEGYDVVSSYCSYDEAAKKIAIDKPDVILLDIELPGINGIDAIPKLKKLLPNCLSSSLRFMNRRSRSLTRWPTVLRDILPKIRHRPRSSNR